MRDLAIRNLYPEAVTIGGLKPFDKDYKEIVFDETLIEEEITRLTEIKDQEDIVSNLKAEGEIYPNTDYKVSFTSYDAVGMMQVESAFNKGQTNTNIKFSNGTIMPIQSIDFQDFAIWFADKRNSFFI